MRMNRRTKRQYEELFHNAETLFPGVKVTLWPNAQPEIWFANKEGYGFRLRAGNGPNGLGLDCPASTTFPGRGASQKYVTGA